MKAIPKIPPSLKNPIKLERLLKTKPENYWIERGEKRAIELFHLMSKRVPAYKDFLKKNRIDPGRIKTIKDFKNVPFIDKNNYIRSYPLESLCWDGNIKGRSWIISATSGSTGELTYFPHEEDQDWQYALEAELYLRANFQIHKKSTLYIVGFMMGAWIGGVFTYTAIRLLAKRGGYKISVITPGIDKIGIINAVKKLGHHFDQIIIGSYGPFLKDVLDDGVRLGLNWKEYNLGFIFSAEGFSEEVRDYVLRIAGNKNTYTATLNHYGTVDFGFMSYETPVSILARRIAIKNRNIYKDLFGDTIKLPTFTQVFPEQLYFEEVDGVLVGSGYGGLPLVRYDLKDIGGVYGFEELKTLFKDNGVDILKKIKEVGITDTVWNLPFVYVFERNDFMVKFYLCDVYPETIKKALQHPELEKLVTGKFTMMIKFDESKDQYLEINTELKADIKETKELKSRVAKIIANQLLKENKGYGEVYKQIGGRAIPHVVFWPYEHPQYFRQGIKQKWVKKE
ncbi:MAG: hypothetical protein US60_C0032G0002 [Microgenomates group bacterium GW2011_GWC1_37_8]|uniref:Phenylacetate-CoA ligase n=1 Tax=Candidatus Woesebacteria bacterium GW2011_GWB1_38_8 TaxID=1618570 RepID=A0A0G0NH49_9BACT|nr:MAG: hypothetical protein US60_C0032G0002 [Microgenomates group bacterium GW2011_GWC1_37_8]KKQ85209.1 MAG: hypothetical protein UT08_C0009G0043 [Candidatus Woesebacteria bacterium GW2011_GWB1_38_8]